MTIDKSSSEFMFGQILQRLEEGDRYLIAFKEEMTSLSRSINQLPCKERERRINALEEWRNKLNANTLFKSQSFIKFRYTLLASLLSAVFTSGLMYLVIKVSG